MKAKKKAFIIGVFFVIKLVIFPNINFAGSFSDDLLNGTTLKSSNSYTANQDGYYWEKYIKEDSREDILKIWNIGENTQNVNLSMTSGKTTIYNENGSILSKSDNYGVLTNITISKEPIYIVADSIDELEYIYFNDFENGDYSDFIKRNSSDILLDVIEDNNNKCLKISNRPSYAQCVKINLSDKLAINTDYLISFKIKNDNGGKTYLRYYYYDDNNKGRISELYECDGEGWQTVRNLEFSFLENQSRAYLYFISDSKESCEDIYIDDFTIVKPLMTAVRTFENSLQEVAKAYYSKTIKIQYNSRKAKLIYYSPEEVTSQNMMYMVCSAFTRNVYYELLGIKIPAYTQSLIRYAKNNFERPEVIGYGCKDNNVFKIKLQNPYKESVIIENPEIKDILPYLKIR